MIVNRFQLVEIVIPANSPLKQFNFPDQPQLTGVDGYPVTVNKIEFYKSNDINTSPLSGASVLNMDTAFNKFALTLYQGDLASIYNAPLNIFSRVQADGNGSYQQVFDKYETKLQNVSWTKSYVSTSEDFSAVGTPTSLLFGIYYTVEVNA